MTIRTATHRWTFLLVVVAASACRHRTETSLAPSPMVWPRDEHCWWIALRTTLPADSVARRFSQAFASLGLAEVVSARVGDTLLVRGGPTELRGAHAPGVYASRMVAYVHGDSTRFRWYASITPLVDQTPASADSNPGGSAHIPFCGDIGKAVAIQGWAPRDPTADDSISVWTRVP
jgi:hypothetical protein